MTAKLFVETASVSITSNATIGLILDIVTNTNRHLNFHDAISIQKTMPFGSPEDVRSEVKDRVEPLASSGGYIFCTAHNIQSDTSLDHIEALFRAYKNIGAYS